MNEAVHRINRSLSNYYAERFTSGTHDSQKVGWKNHDAQRVRFQQFLKLIPAVSTHFSIVDLGCGLGHFYDFLLEHRTSFSYVGLDMLETMVKQAQEMHSDQPECKFRIITASSEMPEADFSVASGIFNLRFEMTTAEWRKYIFETIDVMNNHSRCGFAFNALTAYSDKDFMRPELHYSDPCEFFDYCKRNCSDSVSLHHDYGQHDFTILVKKQIT